MFCVDICLHAKCGKTFNRVKWSLHTLNPCLCHNLHTSCVLCLQACQRHMQERTAPAYFIPRNYDRVSSRTYALEPSASTVYSLNAYTNTITHSTQHRQGCETSTQSNSMEKWKISLWKYWIMMILVVCCDCHWFRQCAAVRCEMFADPRCTH